MLFSPAEPLSPFTLQDKAARRFRNTDDVDCVIGIGTRKQYRDLEKRLQSLGLLNQFEGYDFCLRGKREYSINEIFTVIPKDDGLYGLLDYWVLIQED
jgi:hypothetical protein